MVRELEVSGPIPLDFGIHEIDDEDSDDEDEDGDDDDVDDDEDEDYDEVAILPFSMLGFSSILVYI